MRDHFELLVAVDATAQLRPAEANRLVKQTNKILLALLKASSLERVRALPHTVRQELTGRLDVSFTFPELKAISKAWEPKRKIEEGETQTDLGRNLTSLMQGVRKPYVPVDSRLTLNGARNLPPDELGKIVSKIRDWAPKADIKKLLKKWDKYNEPALAAGRNRQADHIADLLAGRVAPCAKPPRA